MTDLAKRAVACKGWRWMPGMRLFGGATVTYADDFIDIVLTGDATVRRWGGVGAGPLLPDLTDPATRGCLLQLVREAWNEPQAFAMCTLGMWFVRGPVKPLWLPSAGKDSEIEILVAALEAAP